MVSSHVVGNHCRSLGCSVQYKQEKDLVTALLKLNRMLQDKEKESHQVFSKKFYSKVTCNLNKGVVFCIIYNTTRLLC